MRLLSKDKNKKRLRQVRKSHVDRKKIDKNLEEEFERRKEICKDKMGISLWYLQRSNHLACVKIKEYLS